MSSRRKLVFMKSIHNKFTQDRSFRFAIILVIVLLPTIFTSLVVVKSYANDEKSAQPDLTEEEDLTQQIDDQVAENDKEQDEVEDKDAAQTGVHAKIEEKSTGKVVYLTFDDGPSQFTNQFLDILQEQEIKATFFMQGSNLHKESLQEGVKRAAAEGHYIGAHSMTHDFKILYKDQQFVPEMKETINLIHDITGITPNLVRAPYGSAPGLNSEQIRNQIADLGIKVWDWTIDSMDWALMDSPMQIVENIKNGTKKDKEVVLMHEKRQTLEVLTEVIAFYKDQGYEFAVYDEENHFDLNFQNDGRL